MSSSYLIAVTHRAVGAEVIVALWNTAGRGNPVCGFSDGTFKTDLWVIPKGRRNKEEVLRQLQEVSAIRSISVVGLSNPVHKDELSEVRDLFMKVGWDSSEVTDEMVLLFLNSKLEGQYSYYVDYNVRERSPRKICIKRIEDHPGFSPDWLKSNERTTEDAPDKQYTTDDFKISTVNIDSVKRKPPRAPRPTKNKNQKDK